MLNLIAFILCTAGAIAQWNSDWALFTVCVIFSIANLFFAVCYLKNKIKNKIKKKVN